MDIQDTIAAISTPYGEGGIGIVRISGKDCQEIAMKVYRGINKGKVSSFSPYKATLGYIIDPKNNVIVDQAIAVFMPTPRSYTGEDVIEFQCHGGIYLLRKVLELTISNGARLALPGEFTKRAFLNGRVDLTQAESVIDIIKADSDAAAISASSILQGSLLKKTGAIETSLIELSALIEASIDFPEDDISTFSYKQIKEKLKGVKKSISILINSYAIGKLCKEGIGIVISGRPNVGKSSLINSFLHEQRTIVSQYPGTTRDTIEESLSIDGVKIKIKDTAGIRKTTQEVEKEGICRAIEAIGESDIVIFLLDLSQKITQNDIMTYSHLKNSKKIVVGNKCDLPRLLDINKAKKTFNTQEIICISAKEDIGINKIIDGIKKISFGNTPLRQESAYITRKRHKDILIKAREAIDNALQSTAESLSQEFIALDINEAILKMGEITGKNVSEDILDKIFSEFCIGK